MICSQNYEFISSCNYDFYLTILTFFICELKVKKKKKIGGGMIRSQNYEFISPKSDFYLTILTFFICELKSNLFIYFFWGGADMFSKL